MSRPVVRTTSSLSADDEDDLAVVLSALTCALQRARVEQVRASPTGKPPLAYIAALRDVFHALRRPRGERFATSSTTETARRCSSSAPGSR